MAIEGKSLNNSQRALIRRRNMNPKNYQLLRDDWDKLIILDLRYGKVKIVHKATSL